MPRLADTTSTVPVCPICDGPCEHDFVRSDRRVPDRLPRAVGGTADPEPPAPDRPANRRGRRTE